MLSVVYALLYSLNSGSKKVSAKNTRGKNKGKSVIDWDTEPFLSIVYQLAAKYKVKK